MESRLMEHRLSGQTWCKWRVKDIKSPLQTLYNGHGKLGLNLIEEMVSPSSVNLFRWPILCIHMDIVNSFMKRWVTLRVIWEALRTAAELIVYIWMVDWLSVFSGIARFCDRWLSQSGEVLNVFVSKRKRRLLGDWIVGGTKTPLCYYSRLEVLTLTSLNTCYDAKL